MTNTELTYLIAGVTAVLSVGLWAWLVVMPAFRAYAGWWQRTLAMVMSLYVLAAMLGAGALVGALFLWYYDRLG